jgi:hypothetical protein
MYPSEDWDLLVATDANAELLLRLAVDPTCINRDAALNFLYVYAGQVVREGAHAESVAALQTVIDLSASFGLDEIRLWAARATAVLAGRGPSPRPGAPVADYEFWFGCGWRKAAR